VSQSDESLPHDNRPLILRRHLVNQLTRLSVIAVLGLLLALGVSKGSYLGVAVVAAMVLLAAGLVWLRYRLAVARLPPIARRSPNGSPDPRLGPSAESTRPWRAFLAKGRISSKKYLGGVEHFDEDAWN
jgi:hypothetical protein